MLSVHWNAFLVMTVRTHCLPVTQTFYYITTNHHAVQDSTSREKVKFSIILKKYFLISHIQFRPNLINNAKKVLATIFTPYDDFGHILIGYFGRLLIVGGGIV